MTLPTRHEVVGLEQRFGGETLDVLVFRDVEDPIAIAPGADCSSEAELCEVLRNSRRSDADMLRQSGDRVLAVEERPNDGQASRISQKLQRLGCGLELCSRWL